jgi:hypothetical protein
MSTQLPLPTTEPVTITRLTIGLECSERRARAVVDYLNNAGWPAVYAEDHTPRHAWTDGEIEAFYAACAATWRL